MPVDLTPAKEAKRQELIETIQKSIAEFLTLPQLDVHTECDINTTDDDADRINAIAIQLARYRFGRGNWPVAITVTNTLRYNPPRFHKVLSAEAAVSDTDVISRIDAIAENAKAALDSLVEAFVTPARDAVLNKLDIVAKATEAAAIDAINAKAAAQIRNRPRPAVGRYADAVEILPRVSEGIDHGVHRVVLVRNDKRVLLWLPRHYSRGVYKPARWVLTQYGVRSKEITVCDGGRLTLAKLALASTMIYDYLGARFALKDIRDDSTLLLHD